MSLHTRLRHLFHPQRSNNHRPRVLHSQALLYLAFIGVGFFGLLQGLVKTSPNVGMILGFASSITPAQVVELTNAQRAQVGLPPLKLNSRLTAAALAKGQDMFNDQYWSHIAPDGKEPWSFMREAGYSYRVAGENLARDFSNSNDMMRAWMNSPTHRANIINNRYEEIGIAVIDGSLGGYETTLVVQMFGLPQASVTSVNNEEEREGVTQEAVSVVDVAPEEEEPSEPTVLAGALITQGDLEVPPLFSALQLTKAFFLALILMIVFTLVYDGVVISNYDTARMVGKNLAHIIFLAAVCYLLIFFKGGIIG